MISIALDKQIGAQLTSRPIECWHFLEEDGILIKIRNTQAWIGELETGNYIPLVYEMIMYLYMYKISPISHLPAGW
jgi:hypothetical protein